ncbi:MAG: DUF3795 domain-containing protein [Spirochaetales bacterium]|nr:DUF3795 domain-containing protein [Spirochaetales bacterium]
MENDMILGYCGLYCGGCGIYQAARVGNPVKAEDGSLMLCEGCNGSKITEWCTNCAIKSCNRTKGIRYCLECDENPCDILKNFMDDEQYPYHKEVQDNMKRLREIGLEKWINEQQEKYTCPECGHTFNWFDKKCPACHGDS